MQSYEVGPPPELINMKFPKDNPLKKGLDLFQNLPAMKFNPMGQETKAFVDEVENATLEHIQLAVRQGIKIQDIMNRTTKNFMRTYAPDFVYPFYERIDEAVKPYTGENLQKTLTTQYESAYAWVKSMAPAPTHQFIEQFDKWFKPFKYDF